MKNILKSISICALLGILSVACNSDKFTIDAYIKDLEDQRVFLSRPSEEGTTIIDTAISEGGHFSFKGKMEYNDYRIITFENMSGEIDMYIDNSPIKIEGDYADLENASITGSPAMDFFLSFGKANNDWSKYSQECLAEMQEAQKANDTAKAMAINKKYIEDYIEYMNTNFARAEERPEDLISFFVALNSATYITPERMQAFYDNVPSYRKQDPRIAEQLGFMERMTRLSKGNDVPEFQLSSYDLKDTLTTEMLKGDKYALYITAPDMEANDYIFPILERAHEKGIKVVVAMLLVTSDMYADFSEYQKNEVLKNFEVFISTEEFAKDMNAVTPRVFFIDEDTRFIATGIDEKEIESIMESIPAATAAEK